jgi:hypothetical protein
VEDREIGFAIGVLVGEGHFGGDGRQPHISLRMHSRHEKTLRRVATTFPGARLYGPYHHGGRDYYQLMIRGEPLRQEVIPLLRHHLDLFDDHVLARFTDMCERYGL